MNPFSTAPLFVSLTANYTPEKQRQQAFRACIYAFCILATFLLIGAWIISFFGISVPGMRVAGGLIISTLGFRMLFPVPALADSGAVAPQQEEIAFTPIAMPSLAGPGSIAVVLSSAAQIQGIRAQGWLMVHAAVITGMVGTLVLAYGVLRAASKLVTMMGPAGTDAMTRIFGFLLICIGMQFLLTGIADFYQFSV